MDDLKRRISYEAERIILRRLHEGRIDGYTLPMSDEIAEAILSCPEILTPNWEGQFNTFNDWVNRASRAIGGREDSNGAPSRAMCVDTKGRRCENGRDFMRARDEDAFPVRYFWNCERRRIRHL